MKEKEKKGLFNTLNSLKVGTIIKAVFSDTEEYYIVNDKGNFCQIEILEYGVVLKDESHIDNIHLYFCMKDLCNIEMYDAQELTQIKTTLLEIFFGITRYEAGSNNAEEISCKIAKLKKLLNS